MKTDFLTLRDFAYIKDKNISQIADSFQDFIDQMDDHQIRGYDIPSITAINANMTIRDHYDLENKNVVSFVSSNYLGMNQHPDVIEASNQAALKFGTGTCTSPIIGGYIELHRQLEESISTLHNKENAQLFTSGYSANVGVLQALLCKDDIALVDMFVHASVFDGLSNTNIKLLKHNDLDYLESVLKNTQGKYRNVMIIVDGVYSQDGDLSRLDQIADLGKRYGAFIFMDDAHGVGVVGENGRGTANLFKCDDKIDLITGTFSKTFGSQGGYVTGSQKLIQYLKYYARSNTFSAAVSPPATAASLKAIEKMFDEPNRITKLWENANYFKTRMSSIGFDIGHSESPIIPVMIRDDFKVKKVARMLMERGIYVIPIIYPAVKSKESRLRVNIASIIHLTILIIFLIV